MNAPPPDPRQALGQLLRKIRREEGLTLVEIGRRLSYDYTAISRFERAERTIPKKYVDDLCRELQVPDEVKQTLDELHRASEDTPAPAQPAAAGIGSSVASRIAANALAAWVGSGVAVWLWRLGVYHAWHVREPGVWYELSWGIAVGLGLALGLGLFKVASAGSDRARTAKGQLVLAGLAALGGAVGGLLWTCTQPLLSGSPLPTLEETVLWGAIYAAGFASPFLAAGLLWMRHDGDRHRPRLRTLASAALATVLGTGALVFAAWVVLYSVVPQMTQPLHDVLVSLCLRAGLAAGFAIISSLLLPSLQS